MKRAIHACLPLHQMTGVEQPEQICFLFLCPCPLAVALTWYLAFTSNSHLITLIPSAPQFQTALYSYLAQALASYCGITCPQWHNKLVEGPGEGQGHSLFWPFPVRGSICLRCGFDTLSLPKNWNKQNHENDWVKRKPCGSGGKQGEPGYFWQVYLATLEL